jgi:hypothetical protein
MEQSGQFVDSLNSGWQLRQEPSTPSTYKYCNAEVLKQNADAARELATVVREYCSDAQRITKTLALLADDHVIPSEDQRGSGGGFGQAMGLLTAKAGAALRSLGVQHVQQAAEELLRHVCGLLVSSIVACRASHLLTRSQHDVVGIDSSPSPTNNGRL